MKPGRKSLRTEIELAMPPSVNALWINVAGKGRVRSDHYRNWIDAAGWELKTQKPRAIVGAIAVKIKAGAGGRARDIDNIIKPLLDLLVTHEPTGRRLPSKPRTVGGTISRTLRSVAKGPSRRYRTT